MNIAQKQQKKCLKVCKNAAREAKNGTAGLRSEPGWTKMGPPGATFVHFGGIFGYLGRSFVHFYAFLLGFREHLYIFDERSWENHKTTANCTKNNEYYTKTQKKYLKVCKNAPCVYL
ncbi:MAG: hypothetical protein GY841_19090 [FCB group bacterium]|nr:hypothetical protein [FCB group bacterium]